MKLCPRCASEITSKMKKCDRCGLPLDKVNFSDEVEEVSKTEQNAEQAPENKSESGKEKRARLKAEKKAKKLAKKQAIKEKRERESVSDTDFSKYATNAAASETDDEEELMRRGLFGTKKVSNKKNKQAKPVFELDENGEFNIDTDDVEIVGKETGKLIDEQYTRTYSVKKARGDYRPPKIKWWEIYKIADRAFARRKIKKEVNKAAKIKPSFISKGKLLTKAIFLGWCGTHNFYAKNYKKGWVQIISFLICAIVTIFSAYVPFLARVQISIGGFAGFVFMVMWFSDIFNIILNTYKYRIQKEGFIFAMNIETRAKLGEKYVDLELYKKPWWVKFKVWCQKKKRGYEEWKHDHRQRMIEKEKAKLAKKEEQEKIEAEIAAHEEKENAEIAKRSNLVVDQKILDELKSFGDNASNDTKVLKAEPKKEKNKQDSKIEESSKEEKKEVKPKAQKAKVSVKTNSKKSASKKNNSKKK